jgi:glycosyltransferase involved in cell wall biosynthesis
MEKSIRILNVTTVFRAAGIESFIMNMYRNIDRSKVQFDFMVMRNENEYYDNEIAELGGKKFTICVTGNNTLFRILKESVELYKFLKKNPYKIVHIHYTTPLRAFYLLAAKKAGVPVRIYHSHSAEVSGKSSGKLAIYNFCRKKISKWATNFWACSQAAAKWMYSEEALDKSVVIYNGIDIDKYKFNQTARGEIRKKLSIEDNFVVVHTGRFLDQKNHKFIVDVFKMLKQRCSEAKLLLVGTGDLLVEIQQLVKMNSLEESVLFLGVRSDVNRILSAADCYIMPSLYEGLPVAAVEAECSGLPCILSTNITREIELTDNVKFLSLDDDIIEWCDQLLKAKKIIRKDSSAAVANCGYDIQEGARRLQEFYIKVVL